MMSPAAETATSRLRDEHQLILQVADAMQALLASAEGPDGLDLEAIGDCVTFIRLFADACHHGKEEDLLFPELEAAGLPRNQGPIAVMLYEHQQGRAFAQQMADALAPARQGDSRWPTRPCAGPPASVYAEVTVRCARGASRATRRKSCRPWPRTYASGRASPDHTVRPTRRSSRNPRSSASFKPFAYSAAGTRQFSSA